jgi:hypothetical protein
LGLGSENAGGRLCLAQYQRSARICVRHSLIRAESIDQLVRRLKLGLKRLQTARQRCLTVLVRRSLAVDGVARGTQAQSKHDRKHQEREYGGAEYELYRSIH